MKHTRYWDEDDDSQRGRREERDYLTKYRHKIYDYTDDDDEYVDDEGYSNLDDYEEEQ
jgi:hypothetical protein